MSAEIADQLLRVEDHDIIPSCLSAERHKPRDFLLHYMGCEQFFQREEYLGSLNMEQVLKVESRLQQIQYLRSVLSNDLAEGRQLTQHLSTSFKRWRNTKDFQDGIKSVRDLRTMHFAVNGVTQKDVDIDSRSGEYNPDVDTNAYLIRLRNGRPVHDIMDSRFHQDYPCYTVSVQDLLYDGENQQGLLNAPSGCINYFHFPANNMLWAEQAITKYLQNKPPPSATHGNGTGISVNTVDDTGAGNGNFSQSHSILGQRYWKSKLQSSTVTGKYLRPMCEVVSATECPDDGQESIALFMPFLNWDTARHQARISRAVTEETERYRKEKLQRERQLAGMRRARHPGLRFLNAQSRQPGTAWRLENRHSAHASLQGPTNLIPHAAPRRTATGAFASIMKRHGRLKVPLWSVFTTDDKGRVIAGTEIGQVLFDAAMVYEAMSTYREKSLIHKYLNEDPPLHPRRTLEQTNEWTLSLSWHASARDQVVHRATRPKQLDFHSVGPFTKEWRDRVRKVPRVMMIDQLWMWILDEQTIITCFPDQRDLSGHASLPTIFTHIRDAIVKAGRGRVQTVFDIAVTVLSEAQLSRAALSSVKLQDGQIGVMQIFRQAIRDVAAKHSFGAEQYWEWARIFSRLAHADVDNGLSDLIVPFLDIGKEGELQGQIKSVVRDLEIMLRVSTEQQEVVEKFEKIMAQISSSKPGTDFEPILMEIHSNMEDLDDMRRSADDITNSLDYLISLKQQQVTVVQAWQSMKQGEDNQRQNLTLLVFTVVTVVFLPMSFISSVFGMNNKEIAGLEAPMTLSQQFKWMFPLSFAIVAITYYTAFGSPGRMSRDIFRWIYIKCGMYRLFAPDDLTFWGLVDRYLRSSKKKEAEQAWVRRRSEQMARDAQDRRQATRRAAVFDHSSISPDTPVMTPALATPHSNPQTGMFAVYQDLNNLGGKRGRTPDAV